MKTFKKALFLISLVISCAVWGQDGKNIYEAKLGYGFYQGFNIGINYFYAKNISVGLGVGLHLNSSSYENDKHINVFIENNLDFGKRNQQGIKPWFVNQQIMYWELGPVSSRWSVISPGLNIGRTFAITNKLGLSCELGPAYNWVVNITKEEHAEQSGWIWPVLYNGRMQLRYLF